MSRLSLPPPSAQKDGRYLFGRYRAPIVDPNIMAPGPWPRMRLKEWVYLSVTTDRCMVAFAIAQLGYVAQAFCYLVDRQEPARLRLYDKTLPFGWGATMAPSSTCGVTEWRHGAARMAVRFDDAWRVTLDVPLSGARLSGELTAEPVDALALLHPLAPDRAAYTHKAAGVPVRGAVTLGTERYDLDGGLASLDWTRAAALRETRWKWASLSTRASGVALGLNLSAEVYDDAHGHSRENAAWVDGSVEPLGGVAFTLPEDLTREPWCIRSMDEGAVDLTFEPLGARADGLNVGLVQSDFVQAYGLYQGTVQVGGRSLEVRDALGVAERHLARW